MQGKDPNLYDVSILAPFGKEFTLFGELEKTIFDFKKEYIQKVLDLIKQIPNFQYSYIFHLIIQAAQYRLTKWKEFAELWSNLEKPTKKISNYPFTEYLVLKGILKEQDLRLVLSNSSSDSSDNGNLFKKGSLEEALVNDNWEKVKELLADKDLNTLTFFVNENAHSILTFAAFFGAQKCFKNLVSMGCKIDDETIKNAGLGGNVEIIKTCQETGYSLGGCLKYAVTSHSDDAIHYLLKNVGFEPVEITRCIKACNTVAFIFFAARVVSSSPFNSKFAQSHKDPPLKVAAEYAHFAAVKYLIENGANVDAPDEKGWSPLSYAIDYKYMEIASYLLSHGAHIDNSGNMDWTPLLWACSTGNLISTQFLVEKGANVEAKNADGNTPIMVALKGGHIEIAELLIKKKPNLEVRDKENFTILQTTAMTGLLEGVKLLVEHGAQIEAAKNGLTAFYFAVLRGNYSVAEYLLDHGAKIDVMDDNRITPLLFCSSYGLCNNAKFLIEHGADLEARDKKKCTPLIWATKNKKYDLMKLLLDSGANINAQNSDGETPLIIAVKKMDVEAVKILILNYPDKQIKDAIGNTAVSMAQDLAEKDIINLLNQTPEKIEVLKKQAKEQEEEEKRKLEEKKKEQEKQKEKEKDQKKEAEKQKEEKKQEKKEDNNNQKANAEKKSNSQPEVSTKKENETNMTKHNSTPQTAPQSNCCLLI